MQLPQGTVVLLRTWNRPALLRQSLPQIVAETEQIAARLVICDDRSSDPETVALLRGARASGADVISNPGASKRGAPVDSVVHATPRDAVRALTTSPAGAQLISRCARQGRGADAVRRGLLDIWNQRLTDAHVSAQKNYLYGLRHVLANYPRASWLLSVDDDVAMQRGAFNRMLEIWARAEADGYEVLSVSGIRTVNEAPLARRPGYTITAGICNVAALFSRSDWERFLEAIPEWRAIRDGCDLAFSWGYAPRYRPAAVAVSVRPSVVYHTGRNGLHVRDTDLNCEYVDDQPNIVVS